MMDRKTTFCFFAQFGKKKKQADFTIYVHKIFCAHFVETNFTIYVQTGKRVALFQTSVTYANWAYACFIVSLLGLFRGCLVSRD
jgi:hypothetical protein